MAVITQTSSVKGSGIPAQLARSVLTASDTLTYSQGSRQVLILFNTTASPVPVTLTGSAATTVTPPGFGGTVSVAAGKVVTVPASSTTHVELDDIYAFLQGTVTVTGGTGLTAHLYN
jgi:hypothetical protein